MPITKALATRAPVIGALALLLLVTPLLYWPVVRAYFVADDFGYIADLSRRDWGYIPRIFFGEQVRMDEYRPMRLASVLAQVKLCGPDPTMLHVANILLHIGASALLWRFVVTAPGGGPLAGLLALAFFVTAPIHEEPVSWIDAREHVMVTIFVLGCLLLMRRFRKRRTVISYLGLLACTIAAFTTLEMAVMLPALVLLVDVGEQWLTRYRISLRGILAVHVPIWAIAAIYLAGRIRMFGRISPATTDRSPLKIAHDVVIAGRDLLISSVHLFTVPMPVKIAVIAVMLLLMVAPLLVLRGNQLFAYVLGAACFGVGWIMLATVPIIDGWGSQRHFYLASVGLAALLGLAGARLLRLKSRQHAAAAAVGIAGLLGFQTVSLANGVQTFAHYGELSRQLTNELSATFEDASADSDALVVLLPDLPDWHRPFWKYAMPAALLPPFTRTAPPPGFITSLRSCGCSHDEWLQAYGAEFRRLLDGRADSVYLIELDPQQDAFHTRVMPPGEFQAAGYGRSDGPLLTPQ